VESRTTQPWHSRTCRVGWRALASVASAAPTLTAGPASADPAILADHGPERHFDLICWNQANCVTEAMQRPYLAAVSISSEGFHDPADRFGLVAPMTQLRIRYEDEPERRPATAEEIVATLDAFRASAPWPLPEG
jgi:hypothetical protein